MADCVALARKVGAEVADRFAVPVYLYEDASANPARRNLEDIRRGEFEGLSAKMAQEGWAPDFGGPTPHPTAGATVVGARMPLIAYNINLATDRLDVAKKIAAAIRFSRGGFRFVKAMGIALEDRGIVQVSMNLTNYEKTPIFRVFEVGHAGKPRATASTCWKARSSASSPRPRSLTPPSTTCSSPGSRANRCWRTGSHDERRASNDERRLDRLLLGLGAARRRDAERPHLAIQVAALDAEHLGGPRHVALLLGERAQNQIALELVARFVERLAPRRLLGRLRPADGILLEERQVDAGDRIARHHDHQPLDDVAQLADVARPRVALEHGDRAGIERLQPAVRTRARTRP